MADRNAAKAPSTRVLLVDDNVAGLAARCVVLEELGYETTRAECPAQALKLFQAALKAGRPFDLLVTDFRMPIMNGLELIQQVRAAAAGTPIILISGFVDALGLTEAGTGANVVIMKSANEVQHLVRAAKRLLGASAVRKPPRRTGVTAARRKTG
jgi:CheY-like chemotaxis protein